MDCVDAEPYSVTENINIRMDTDRDVIRHLLSSNKKLEDENNDLKLQLKNCQLKKTTTTGNSGKLTLNQLENDENTISFKKLEEYSEQLKDENTNLKLRIESTQKLLNQAELSNRSLEENLENEIKRTKTEYERANKLQTLLSSEQKTNQKLVAEIDILKNQLEKSRFQNNKKLSEQEFSQINKLGEYNNIVESKNKNNKIECYNCKNPLHPKEVICSNCSKYNANLYQCKKCSFKFPKENVYCPKCGLGCNEKTMGDPDYLNHFLPRWSDDVEVPDNVKNSESMPYDSI